MVRGRPAKKASAAEPQHEAGSSVPPPDLTALVAQLQQQLAEQQQEIALKANQQTTPPVTPVPNLTTPVITEVVPAQPAVPVPVAPVAGAKREAYLIQWQRIKPENFSGTSEPWDAQAWFKTLESTMELLDWPEHEKVKCASFCLTGDARMCGSGLNRSGQ